MSDNNIEVKFGAQTGDLKTGLNDAAGATDQGVQKMTNAFAKMAEDISGHTRKISESTAMMAEGVKASGESVSGVLEMMRGKFMMITAILGGGAMFKEAIKDTLSFTREVASLHKVLGITYDEASNLNIALKLIGSSAQDFNDMAFKMTRQLRTNADGLAEMGIKTKDAQGNTLAMTDIMRNGAKALLEYKEGFDRDAAAMEIFGRGAQEAMAILKLNDQVMTRAKDISDQYNLKVGKEGVEATKAYKQEQAAVGIVMDAMNHKIGEAVLPALTKLAGWFSDVGPTVIEVFTFALKNVIQFLEETVFGIRALWEAGKDMYERFMALVDGISSAMKALGKGDWDGAKNAMASAFDKMETIAKTHAEKIVAMEKDASDRVAQLWREEEKHAGSEEEHGGGNKQYTPKNKNKETNEMSAWENALMAEKLYYQEQNNLREMSKQEEIAYWQNIVNTHSLTKQEQLAIDKKMLSLRLDIRKQDAAEEISALKTELDSWKFNQDEKLAVANRMYDALSGRYGKDSVQAQAAAQEIVRIEQAKKAQIIAVNDEIAKVQQDAALNDVDMAQKAAELQVSLGQMTAAQMLTQEAAFEEQRYNIKREAIAKRIELMLLDPDHDPKALATLLAQSTALYEAFELKKTEIRNKSAVENAQYALAFQKGMESSMNSVLSSFLKGTMSIKDLMKGMVTAVLDAFTNMIAQWGAKMAANWIMQKVGSKVTALSEIMSNAAVAGSAAYASTAAIPVVGPGLAPDAAAAAYAGASSFGVELAAEKGFDVPAGMNPVTQLHQKEMVLPASQADVIRNMANNGGGTQQPVTVNISAVDSKSVRDLFMREGSALADSLQKQARNFKMTGVSLVGAR